MVEQTNKKCLIIKIRAFIHLRPVSITCSRLPPSPLHRHTHLHHVTALSPHPTPLVFWDSFIFKLHWLVLMFCTRLDLHTSVRWHHSVQLIPKQEMLFSPPSSNCMCMCACVDYIWLLCMCTQCMLTCIRMCVEQQWQKQHEGVDPRVHWECLRKCKQLKQSMMLSSLLSWAPKITGPLGTDWQHWAGDSQQTDPEQPGPD